MKTSHLLTGWLSAACVLASHATEVSSELQGKLGIKLAALEKAKLPPDVPVYASVISPAPLIDLFRQSEVARASAAVSQDSLDRAEKLFAAGQLVARKDLEAARAMQVQEKAKILVPEDRLALEWGPTFAAMPPADRTRLIEGLLAGKSALLRLTISRGAAPVLTPVAARLQAPGGGGKTLRITNILPSPVIDPAFQSQTFIGLAEKMPSALPVGSLLSGVMELEGTPREGLLVPQDAVVYYTGKSWIYQNKDGDEFERVEIPATQAVGDAWFIAPDALEAGKVVVTGAQSLLSQETLDPEAAGD